MTKDNNYENNIEVAEKLVDRELKYEELRYNNIQKKASTYIGLISLFVLLLIELNNGLIAGLKSKIIILPLINILYLGLFFLFLSIIFSIFAFKPREFKRPNVEYVGKGLLINKEMEKSKSNFKAYVLKNISDIISINSRQNNSSAKWLLASMVSFIIGFAFVAFSLIGGL